MGVAPSNRQRHHRKPPRRNRPLQPPANRHRPFPFVAFVDGQPQTPKRLGDTALFAVLVHEQEHP